MPRNLATGYSFSKKVKKNYFRTNMAQVKEHKYPTPKGRKQGKQQQSGQQFRKYRWPLAISCTKLQTCQPLPFLPINRRQPDLSLWLVRDHRMMYLGHSLDRIVFSPFQSSVLDGHPTSLDGTTINIEVVGHYYGWLLCYF